MSLTIIDKTKPPAPRWVYQHIPDFKREVDRIKYRELWNQRYVEGHAGLTGPHLMYLQENHLKIIDGSIIRPTWREADEKYLFQPIDAARFNNKSLLVMKRREIGLTSVGAFMAHYFARTSKGVTINITSDSQPHLYKLFVDKLLVSQDEFHEDIRGSYESKYGGSISKTKSKVGMTIAMKAKNSFGNEIIKTSDIFCNESSESEAAVSKFSSTRAFYTFIDEAALHQRVSDLLAALQPVMMKGTKQLGFLLMGGSVEKSITQASLIKLKGLIDSRLAYNMDYQFIPGYAALEEFMVNGYTDEKAGLEWILKRREFLEKTDDTPEKKMLNSFIKSHPLHEKELFDLGGEGFWEEDSMRILNQVKDDLAKNKPTITPVNLVRLGQEIRVNAVADSPVTILEHPKDRVKYIVGVDSIMSGTEAGEEKGSEFAAIVMKQLDREDEESSYTPVALYHERPKRLVGGAYNTLISLVNYYNQFGSIDNIVCKIFPEANAATTEHLTTYLEGEGMKKFLMNRPDLSGKGNTNKNKKGVYVTIDVLDWQTKQANYHIQKYGYRFRMSEVITALINLGASNSDIGSAFLAALVGMGNKFDKEAPLPPPPPDRFRLEIGYLPDGTTYNNVIRESVRPANQPEEIQYVEFMGIKTPIIPRKA